MKFDYAAPAELFITKTQGRYTAAHWLSLLCHYRRGYSLCQKSDEIRRRYDNSYYPRRRRKRQSS
jgi:hypothetical protein